MNIISLARFVTKHPLNRHRQIAALVGLTRWQIGSRLLRMPVVYPWIRGSRFIVSSGETGLTGNIYCGLHEYQDMLFLLHLLREGDLFLDIGANVGSYTILGAAAAGAEVIAFEPIPQTFERLRRNVGINDVDPHVTLHNIGLADRTGKLRFTGSLNCVNHVLADGEAGAEIQTIPVTTLDEVVAGKTPQLIKIDVEGFELPVLRGGIKTLENPGLHALILELNKSGEKYGFDEAQIIQILSQKGFHPGTYDPFQRRLIRLDGKNQSGGNTIFFRSGEELDELLRTAEPVSVNGLMI